MVKGVYLALTITVLIIFSPSSKPNHNGHHRRLGLTDHLPVFDPLVSKMERYVEEKGVEDQHHTIDTEHDLVIANEVEEVQPYLSEERNLNITMRLMSLFPLLDVDPEDGFISFDEMKHWMVAQAMERIIYRTRKVMADHDRDGDGAVSFIEYLPQFTIDDIERDSMEHGEAGWWKQQFDNADADRNHLLTFCELKDFLHPEDSSNDLILSWLLTEKIRIVIYMNHNNLKRDHDKDGKLSLAEFSDNAYHIFKNYVEFDTGNVPKAEEKFVELDVNNNKFLEAEELRPILHYLSPGELNTANYFTSFLIHEADDNKDGKLTWEEMLHHQEDFYNTIHESSVNDDVDYDHQEF